MKINNVTIYNLENMVKSIVDPEKSDSSFNINGEFKLGEKDLEVIKSSLNNNLMNIVVSMNVEAPVSWWYSMQEQINQEDLVKQNINNPITRDNFEMDDHVQFRLEINYETDDGNKGSGVGDIWDILISTLEGLRLKYNELGDPEIINELIRIMPCSLLYKKSLVITYHELRGLYLDYKNSDVTYWKNFCEYLKTGMPYGEELICCEEGA